MPSRHLPAAIAAVLLLLVAVTEATAASLPAATRTLSASGTTAVRCDQGLRSGRGIATSAYTAPMAGFVDVRSSGARGDWDLAIYDVRNRTRAVAGSNAWGSREVAQSWTTAGERFVIQACRHRGAGTRLPVAITFTDAVMPKADMAPELLRVDVKRNELSKLEATGADVTHSMRVGSV